MKIAINKCYGGFSLSKLGVKRLAELQGKKCFFFKTEYKNKIDRYIPSSIEEKGLFWQAFSVENPNDFMKEDFNSLSQEDRKKYNETYSSISINSHPEDRSDPLLIQVIEELGEKADGECAKIQIVEIPDGVSWEIEDYDGMEHVAETHQTWY